MRIINSGLEGVVRFVGETVLDTNIQVGIDLGKHSEEGECNGTISGALVWASNLYQNI